MTEIYQDINNSTPCIFILPSGADPSHFAISTYILYNTSKINKGFPYTSKRAHIMLFFIALTICQAAAHGSTAHTASTRNVGWLLLLFSIHSAGHCGLCCK